MSNDTNPNPQVFLAVWSGGYEAPSYQALPTADEAMALGKSWFDDASESDTVDVLRIDLVTFEITRLVSA